jgi:RNA polymerase sigma-70 factor
MSTDFWTRARQSWPFVVADAELADAELTLGLDADSDLDEVYLAMGCDAGNPQALRAFDERYLTPLRPLLARQGASADLTDEILQRLREDLLLRREGERRIRLVGYAGSGRLSSLARVSASRMFGYLRRYVVPGSSVVRATVEVGAADGMLRELWSRSEPEVALVQGGQRELFKACFAAASAELDARARALLRFYFVEELTYQQIAELFGVAKSTICRQLTAITRQLLAAITAEWQRRTGEVVDLELGALLDCELDLSMSRLFRP